jgi:hypothetical protein
MHFFIEKPLSRNLILKILLLIITLKKWSTAYFSSELNGSQGLSHKKFLIFSNIGHKICEYERLTREVCFNSYRFIRELMNFK